MKRRLIVLLMLLPLLAVACRREASCDCGCEPASANDATSHALKGVVTSIDVEASTLTVRHEEIPGFMKAMTMVFQVSAADTSRIKKGDAITGQLSSKEGDWHLDEIKVLPPAP